MQKWKRRLILSGSAVFGLGIVYIFFNFVFLNFFVDLWWFGSLNYDGYYLMRLSYRYVIFAAVLLLFFLIFFSNFWFASRYLGTSSQAGACKLEDAEARKKCQSLFQMFQSGSLKIFTPFSFLLAVPIAIPFYERWEEGLLWFFGPKSGIQDPAFGNDISYYLFSYPVYTFIQQEILITFSLLFLALLLLYAVEWHMLSRDQQPLAKPAKIHLTVIAIIVVMTEAWGIILKRIELVYTGEHLPRFFGPGFVDMNLQVPLIWLTAIVFMIWAFSLIFFVHRRKGLMPMLICFSLLLLLVGIRATDFFSDNVQEYIVKPNETVREKPYIENSIKASLNAFNLENIETRDYNIAPVMELTTDADLQKTLRNIPVWDRELLDDVYTQFQSFHQYYTFPNVDVDRYTVQGVYQQVYLAARELNTEGLPEAARNWINRHLQYTHGYGIVMTPAVQGGDEPMTWFVQDIPTVSDFGLSINVPSIYYGEEKYDFAIVPNEMGEIDIHDSANGNTGKANYAGKGGVSLSTLWRKILFAVYFKDKDIFFTPKTKAESRILFLRNITEAVRTVTPFFILDDDPYMVNTSQGLFWIIDAYTASGRYPNAQHYVRTVGNREFGDAEFNYIRNSVKIAVDAYNGNISYYIADPKDPIIRAYSNIYPGLLKNLDQMPAELKTHLRYPQQMFTAQMRIYAKYHQTDPDTFYREEDTWEFAKTGARTLKPYYMTIAMLDKQHPEFILFSPMSPIGRDNLRSLVIVGCDGANYGKIAVFNFPKGRQVSGPAQINAMINQDTEIAQEISLWAQAGSEVIFGRMIMLPVRNGILYIQPLYIRSASGPKIPELKRIIVSQGDMAVMERTIEEALRKLETKLKERSDRIKQRLAVPGGTEQMPMHEPAEEQHPAEGAKEQPALHNPASDQHPAEGAKTESETVPSPEPHPAPNHAGEGHPQ
ncbi:MAG: UPF0182 family protein [Desulfococcaceae bacterium]